MAEVYRAFGCVPVGGLRVAAVGYSGAGPPPCRALVGKDRNPA
jgi:hypothetical protein